MVPRQPDGIVFLEPEGSLMREKPVSGLWEMRMQYSPEALARTPRSPSFAYTLQMMLPSGMEPMGRVLPTTS